jgi:hypothetical protein
VGYKFETLFELLKSNLAGWYGEPFYVLKWLYCVHECMIA